MDVGYKQNKFKNLISDPHNLQLQMTFINLLNSIKSPDSNCIDSFNSELQKTGEILNYDLFNGIMDLLDSPILQYYSECTDKECFKNQLNNMYIQLFAGYQEILPWVVYWDIIYIRYHVKNGLIDNPNFKTLLHSILSDYNKYIDNLAPIYKHYFSKFILEVYLLVYIDYFKIYQDWIEGVQISKISDTTKEFLNYATYEIKVLSLERNLSNGF